MIPEFVVIQSTSTWLPNTQLWLYEQVRFLPEHIRSHVVCESSVNLERFPFPRLTVLQSRGRLPYTLQRARRKLTRSRQFDEWPAQARSVHAALVHSHFADWGWRDNEWVRKQKLPHVVSCYGYDISELPRSEPLWRERYRRFFPAVDRVLCEGPYMAQSILDLGCPESKMRIHRLGVDLETIDYRPRTWDGIGPLKILMAASFTEKKGLTYGVEAIARFAATSGIPVEATIIGDASGAESQQAEKRAILSTIERLNVTGLFRLTGSLPRPRILEEAYTHHIFLSPSVVATDGDSEGGLPVTLIEAVATGMPAIATRHCDVPELIRDDQTGLLAEERDVEGLHTRLSWMAEHPGDWHMLTTAARNLVERNYNAVVQGQALAAIYQQLA